MKSISILDKDYINKNEIHPQAGNELGNRPQLEDDLENILFSIPWCHHKYIIDKCSGNPYKALFYIRQTIENGWSRNVGTVGT